MLHGTKKKDKKESNEENKKRKTRDAQKKRSSHKVRVASPEAGRKSTVLGKICERGMGFELGVKKH